MNVYFVFVIVIAGVVVVVAVVVVIVVYSMFRSDCFALLARLVLFCSLFSSAHSAEPRIYDVFHLNVVRI